MNNLRKIVLAEIHMLPNERVSNDDDFSISEMLLLISGCFCEMDSSSNENSVGIHALDECVC